MTETKTAVSAASAAAAGGKLKKRRKKIQFQGYLWILPALVLLVGFCYIPPVYALIYSFTDWGFVEKISFIGLENYANAFRDAQFWGSFGNVLLFTACGLFFGNVSAIALAEMLYNMRCEKLAAALRYLFMLICIVPGVVSTLVWERVIFLPESSPILGVANALLHLFGLEGSQWYTGSDTIRLAIILTGFPWMGGTSFLIYLAGLQNIETSIMEAGRLDGLNSWKRIWYIDFPLMKGQLKYFLMTGLIGGLQNYSMQLILQNGHSAMVPGYYIYKLGIEMVYTGDLNIYGCQGYACALGMLMFAIIMILTILNNKFLKTTEEG